MASLFTDADNISHSGDIQANMAKLLSESVGSDITFQFDDEKTCKAHRCILALQSPFFNKEFYDGDTQEAEDSSDEDTISDEPREWQTSKGITTDSPIRTSNTVKVSPGKLTKRLHGKSSSSFEALLRYMYTGMLEMSKLKLENVIDILYMAHEYQLTKLADAIGEKLEPYVVKETAVFTIYEAALELKMEELLEAGRQYICENADRFVKKGQFFALSKPVIIDILSLDHFFTTELNILLAIQLWHQEHKEERLREVLECVRLSEVIVEGFKLVELSPVYKLLQENGINLKSIGEADPKGRGPRKKLAKEQTTNVALLGNGTQVDGENAGFALNTVWDNTYNGHAPIDSPITIKFPEAYFVGSTTFFISGGGGNYPCDYKVEVQGAAFNAAWETLAGMCSNCWNTQLLMFKPRMISAVRITCTYSDGQGSNKTYFIQVFQCPASTIADQHKQQYAQVCPNGETMLYNAGNGQYVDVDAAVKERIANVALTTNGTQVEGGGGASIVLNSAFNGQYTGYVPIGSPATVKLPQAFCIGSISFVTFGGGASYACNYKVETLPNSASTSWETLASNCVNCRGIQLLMFKPKTIYAVRITCIYSAGQASYNNYFIQVFQCPASTITDQQKQQYAQLCPNRETMLYNTCTNQFTQVS